jgi:hypothetical protein
MKPIRWKSNILKLATVLIAGLAAFSSLLFVSNPAYAQAVGPSGPTRAATPGTLVNNALERTFSREKDWLTVQTANLQKLTTLSGQVQNLITQAQGRGVDTSDLQSALNTFNARIANAQAESVTAAGVLASHAGFDGNGRVTDAAIANQTLLSARQSLLDAHAALLQATVDFRLAMRAFRAAHHGIQPAYPVPTK